MIIRPVGMLYPGVRLMLEASSEYYPDISEWIDNKLIPGLFSRERMILHAYNDDNEIIGFSILKWDGIEGKICSLQVLPDYRNRAVAFGLMTSSIICLPCPSIIATVPEELWESVDPLLREFKFECEETSELYRPTIGDRIYIRRQE
jgi:hypothetical protein